MKLAQQFFNSYESVVSSEHENDGLSINIPQASFNALAKFKHTFFLVKVLAWVLPRLFQGCPGP